MSARTEKLGLMMYQIPEDDAKTFDIEQGLNENWRKLDDFAKNLKPGMMPTIRVTAPIGSEVTCTNGAITQTKTAIDGVCSFELPTFGVFALQAVKGGDRSDEVQVVVDVVRLYEAALSFFRATLTVTAEDGAEITATGVGHTYKGRCQGSNKAELLIEHPGTYQITATKNGVSSSKASVEILDKGKDYTAAVAFAVLTVAVEAGSTVTATKGGTVLTQESNGAAVFYLPELGSWSVKATLEAQTSDTVAVQADTHKGYRVELSYWKATLAVTAPAGSTLTVTILGVQIFRGVTGGTEKITARKPGTYVLRAEQDGKSTEESVQVSEETTYPVKLAFVSKTLADNTFDVIHEVSEQGLAKSYWAVGDTKPIVINGSVGNHRFDNVEIHLYIQDFDYHKTSGGASLITMGFGKIGGKLVGLCDAQYGSGQSSNGYFNWNPNNSNSGGWKGCYMRNTLLDSGGNPLSPRSSSLPSVLPLELRRNMRKAQVWTDNTGGGSDNSGYVTQTEEALCPPAEFEVFGQRYNANSAEQSHQKQLAYYKAGNSKVHYRHDSTGSAVNVALRSVYSDYISCFVIINDDGTYTNGNAYHSQALAPSLFI